MKILVGMSGGVDSACAAKILMNEGHSVEGAVLVMHEYTETDAAAECARSLKIPLHEIDCKASFNNIIKKNFVDEYSSGRTPNPCIICNERVKFKFLYDFALKNGFDAIATGHYARVRKSSDGTERYLLSRARDVKKDQTYMLYRLPQHILSRLILPLSDMTKEEIRIFAGAEGIISANRPDSQEICFLPEGNHAEYIESVAGPFSAGDFIDELGNVIGRHKGIIRYTVGQRKGLGISLGERAFVTKIDSESNTVTLSKEMSGREEIKLADVVFSGMEKPKENLQMRLSVKLRYTATPVETVATFYGDVITLSFDSPVICAPGQSAVLYENDIVMCGGIIT